MEFKVGDKIIIIPKTKYSWEHPAPHGVQTIQDLDGLTNRPPYVTVMDPIREYGTGYSVERCILIDELSKLERIIYGF